VADLLNKYGSGNLFMVVKFKINQIHSLNFSWCYKRLQSTS